MKKKAFFILIIAIITAVAISAVACKDNDGFDDLEYYDFKDFTSLKNFTVETSQEKNTIVRYENDGSQIRFMTEATDEGITNKVYYVFSSEENKVNIGGEWQAIATQDVDDYLASIADRTGLSYTKIQEAYLIEMNERIYSVEPDHFFKELFRQKYELFFSKSYEENEFAAEYEKQKEDIFGNVDDYLITLDFSQKKQITLKIEKMLENEKQETTFVFTNLGDTKIDLPKQE
ncbi:MAG: hypothetical protein K2G37_06150 [Clostridia bacterium]|nr:hypothetical protein [Clostridia bacterium]MDE7329389.1 hypothetical protein [Clostridia bacterium]